MCAWQLKLWNKRQYYQAQELLKNLRKDEVQDVVNG